MRFGEEKQGNSSTTPASYSPGHLVGLCLCGVCRGCVCPADCGLAGQRFPAYRVGAGCAGTGLVVTA